jgi:hypothetical protein
MYLEACRLGEPPLLDTAEMTRVAARMAELHYGAAEPLSH